ncbi:MAG: hypothetical protein V2J65_32015 [Desulfobacteraceae bacterium]|jgi:hypothetical protein|nr:hypothetical protein [Desulfobacteraceae bacterium]
MEWSTVEFGKYSGKSLPQIMFTDADWFFNGYEKGYFRNDHADEAAEIYRMSRAIRVPSRNGQKMAVEYIVHLSGEKGIIKFGTMQLIPYGPDSGCHNVSSTIDFYIPRSLMWNDKTGYKNFVFALKTILFGNRSHRMNRQACEAFFNDDDNFDLS